MCLPSRESYGRVFFVVRILWWRRWVLRKNSLALDDFTIHGYLLTVLGVLLVHFNLFTSS